MGLKVMTFNVQNNMVAIKNQNYYQKRIPAIIELIKEEKPDIIGTQELTSRVRNQFLHLLDDYVILGDTRYARKHSFNEYNAIMILKEDIKIEHTKTFSLSSHPEKRGSKVWSSIFPRICTYVTCVYKGHRLQLWNTHLDHLFACSRNYQLKKLYKLMKQYSDPSIPILVMGDFNMDLSNHHFDILLSSKQEPIFKSVHNKNSKTTYRSLLHALPIDHIFYTEPYVVKSVKICKQQYQGVYPSDHYPVVVQFSDKKK